MVADIAPRVKPSKRPRYRYILFQVEDNAPERSELIRRIQTAAGAETGAWLTRYEQGRGILRVLRGQEARGCMLLEALPHKVRTVSTSGTIAALERKNRNRGAHHGGEGR